MTDEIIIETDSDSVVVNDDTEEVVVEYYDEAVEVDEDGKQPSLDYRTVINKPSINDVTLVGNKSLDEIGVSKLTNSDIFDIVYRRGR